MNDLINNEPSIVSYDVSIGDGDEIVDAHLETENRKLDFDNDSFGTMNKDEFHIFVDNADYITHYYPYTNQEDNIVQEVGLKPPLKHLKQNQNIHPKHPLKMLLLSQIMQIKLETPVMQEI